ncbi:MAG: 3-oxoacyl-ACP synthase [Cyclobacteriaceae bacterium]
MTIDIKKKLHQACRDSLLKREAAIREALREAQESANEETKSSAGDKHETGRAMMQLETEKLSGQLREVLQEQEKLQQINPDKKCHIVEPGALVITDTLRLYFSISAGKLLIDGVEYFALSAQTPLGQLALGKQEGGTFAFQQRTYRVISVI